MSSPRFSVVIPTRERPTTLRPSLRTCLAQDFADYEIVVCDNCSGPATADVVRELAHPRLKYVRAPQPLAMSANWELALAQTTGEYVLVVGDDDGLIPYALREIDALATRTGARAIRWSPAFYTWPNVDLPGQENYLCVPLSRQLREVDGRDAIRAALTSLDYMSLPMLYTNAAIHRDLIAALRAKSGRVFPCRIPDVYTAFALAYLAETFVSVTVPMSVSGLSGKSNGVACVIRTEANDINREFQALNEANALPTHPWVPNLPLFPIAPVAESFYRARELFFPQVADLDLPRQTLLEKCVGCIRGDDATRAETFRLVRSAAADDAQLLAWFDATFPAPPPEAPPHHLRPLHLGSDGDNLHLDTAAFGVTDVEGAAGLVIRLLSLGNEPFRYDLRGRWDEIKALHADVFESHRLIHAYRAAEAARKERDRRRPINRLRRLGGACLRAMKLAG